MPLVLKWLRIVCIRLFGRGKSLPILAAILCFLPMAALLVKAAQWEQVTGGDGDAKADAEAVLENQAPCCPSLLWGDVLKVSIPFS